MVGAFGQMGARALGVTFCIFSGGILVLDYLCGLVGTGICWQGWRSDFLGLTDAQSVLSTFLLLFH